MDDILEAALAYCKRREFLCKNAPSPCPCGETKQIQLVRWFEKPAFWECRICGHKFSFEPKENVSL